MCYLWLPCNSINGSIFYHKAIKLTYYVTTQSINLFFLFECCGLTVHLNLMALPQCSLPMIHAIVPVIALTEIQVFLIVLQVIGEIQVFLKVLQVIGKDSRSDEYGIHNLGGGSFQILWAKWGEGGSARLLFLSI